MLGAQWLYLDYDIHSSLHNFVYQQYDPYTNGSLFLFSIITQGEQCNDKIIVAIKLLLLLEYSRFNSLSS